MCYIQGYQNSKHHQEFYSPLSTTRTRHLHLLLNHMHSPNKLKDIPPTPDSSILPNCRTRPKGIYHEDIVRVSTTLVGPDVC